VEACLNLPEERYATMSNTTIIPLRQPNTIEDSLTAVLRSGARRLLAQAIEAEAEAFLTEMQDRRLADGRERMVRHGHGPERLVQTGIGPVAVRRVKLRDRGTEVYKSALDLSDTVRSGSSQWPGGGWLVGQRCRQDLRLPAHRYAAMGLDRIASGKRLALVPLTAHRGLPAPCRSKSVRHCPTGRTQVSTRLAVF
jgi:hypothetical protein